MLSEDSKQISFTDDDRCPWISQLLDRQGVKSLEDDTNFIFQFETDGSYKAIDVLQYAMKRLPQRLNTLLDSLVTPD